MGGSHCESFIMSMFNDLGVLKKILTPFTPPPWPVLLLSKTLQPVCTHCVLRKSMQITLCCISICFCFTIKLSVKKCSKWVLTTNYVQSFSISKVSTNLEKTIDISYVFETYWNPAKVRINITNRKAIN